MKSKDFDTRSRLLLRILRRLVHICNRSALVSRLRSKSEPSFWAEKEKSEWKVRAVPSLACKSAILEFRVLICPCKSDTWDCKSFLAPVRSSICDCVSWFHAIRTLSLFFSGLTCILSQMKTKIHPPSSSRRVEGEDRIGPIPGKARLCKGR